jgi:hypothetical protein
MKVLRLKYFRKIFALMAGITFLNMSFIIAELNSIGLGKNNSLLQNVLNSGLEEEEEGGSESSESDSIETELYCAAQENFLYHNIVTASRQYSKHRVNSLFDLGYREVFSPPPEA